MRQSAEETTATAVQSKTLLIHLPRTEHCFARRRCQKPKPISTTEKPNNHGRIVVEKTPAVPVPSAAANPNGRQQPNVATELRIAPTDADTPTSGFIGVLSLWLRRQRGGSRQLAGVRLHLNQDRRGSTKRSLRAYQGLQPRLAR